VIGIRTGQTAASGSLHQSEFAPFPTIIKKIATQQYAAAPICQNSSVKVIMYLLPASAGYGIM
jgi:hypothetical protein